MKNEWQAKPDVCRGARLSQTENPGEGSGILWASSKKKKLRAKSPFVKGDIEGFNTFVISRNHDMSGFLDKISRWCSIGGLSEKDKTDIVVN